MKKKYYLPIIGLLTIGSMTLSACQFPSEATTEIPNGEAVPDGPLVLTGEFEYTNDFVVETYYVEHAVALIDMTGFVLRDMEWELPIEGQVLGYMDLDEEANRASYRLSLPAVPEGQLNDVDQDSQADEGVQIFSVSYNPNLTGGVFSEGDDRTLGWPSYLASVKTDTENQDEIIGGKLVIWAPDGEQDFSSGFGDDGLLFTEDDPQMGVPAGYSVIDLDSSPFEIIRDDVIDITLFEPADIAVKDFSEQSYSEAFDSMFEIASKEYAFNGIEGKQPDWDALYAELAPRIAEAEETGDAYNYYLALRDFSLAFNDGHVGLSGGDMELLYNQNTILGGYGFAVREMDDSTVLIVYVGDGSSADLAGMQVGAELLEIGGMDVQTALDNVPPYSPQSTDFGRRYEQTVFLTRSGLDNTTTVTFQNPTESAQTVELTSAYEMNSFYAVYNGGLFDSNVLPVEYYMDSNYNIGYIRMNSNYDDLGLAVRVFERALKTFEEQEVFGIVIDMRHNYGGASLGLAGFLYDGDIPMGQLEYYSDKSGQFEAEGLRDKVFPNVNQYRFDKMVLLVDQFCYSACEIEAYGFSQVPGMVVMGQFPTAGVEAETARGDFLLPEEVELTIPTGRFTLPDGSIFLEGQGVQPTIKLPVDSESVLSSQDSVVVAAYEYILYE
jgi:C-terminal processing protease CtpA/Prc